MRKHKNHGFYINWLFRTLISVILFSYASGVAIKERKYKGSSNRIDWWSNGYYSSLRDIHLKYATQKGQSRVVGTGFLEEFKRICYETSISNIHYIERKGGFLVIECLNKTAADELAMRIAANTSATFIDHPTQRILPLMMRIRKDRELILALETLSCYDAALQILDDISWNLFVMSRYWYYSATMAIAKSTLRMATVPKPNHKIYSWPRDLLVPDVVLFLKYPTYPITNNMNCATELECIDLGSKATKAFLRMSHPEVIDVYGDYVYGEIDPYERSMEILRKKYPNLLWPRHRSSESVSFEKFTNGTVDIVTTVTETSN